MRPGDSAMYQRLETELLSFDGGQIELPGIHDSAQRASLLDQFLESMRRVKYVSVIGARGLSDRRADPSDRMFDPLKAAILRLRQGSFEEAFWLVFLFVHFGKHARTGYGYSRGVYGRLGESGRWDWASTSVDPPGFRAWLDEHQTELKSKGGFGNHRKYESLDGCSTRGTGAVVESYVRWIDPPRTHQQLMGQACQEAVGGPHEAFDGLYRTMNAVSRFGRTARFDYLSMVGKLGLAPIEPGSTYLKGSTGPIEGARLLFGGSRTVALSQLDLDEWLVKLEAHLDLGIFGMQVLEDALCNWQKSPGSFMPFRA